MEAASLWAGVRFTARNGSPEALLTDAAGQGLHLYGVFSLPGGFTPERFFTVMIVNLIQGRQDVFPR